MSKLKNILATIFFCSLSITGLAQDSFPYPTIPDSIREARYRAKYLIRHYWDNYNFSDTTLLHKQNVAELGFVNFIDLAKNEVEEWDAYYGMKNFISKLTECGAKEEVCEKEKSFFVDLAEKYLYDWNSPMRYDRLYIRFIQAFKEAGNKDERLEWRLEQLCKNEIGKAPTDIKLTTRNGKRTSLRKSKADIVVLMFYQPDCIECRDIIKRLPQLRQKKENCEIEFLAIYPGEDIDIWKKTKLQFPNNWTDCYNTDKKIVTDMIYYIRHTPSFYVISQTDNKVILKDASFNDLLGFGLFKPL